MAEFMKTKIFYILVIIMYLIALSRFREMGPQEFLHVHDGGVFHFPGRDLKELFMWSEASLGVDNGAMTPLLFESAPYVFGYNLGLSVKQIQMIILPIFFVLPFVVSYISLRHLGTLLNMGSKDNISIASLLASLFYVLNPYTVLLWHAGHFPRLAFTYGLFPLFLLTLVRIVSEDNPRLMFLGVLWGVISLLLAPTIIPVFIVLYVFVSLVFSIISWTHFGKKSFLRLMGFFIIFSVSSALVNMWWILPYLHNRLAHAPALANISSGSSTLSYTGLLSEPPGFLDKLMLIMKWTWSGFWDGRYFHSFYPIYSKLRLSEFWLGSFAFIIYWAFVPRFKGIGVLMNFLTKLSGTLLVFFLLMSKGIQPPFGTLFTFLFEKVPLFYMFRNSGHKFGAGIVAIVALLLFLALLKFLEVKKIKKALFATVLVVFLVVFSQGWPLITGVAVREVDKGGMPSNIVSVPLEYREIAEVLNQERDARVLLLSRSYGVFSPGGELNQSYGSLINNPIIYIPIKESYSYTESDNLIKNLFSDPNPHFSNLGIKYILYREDFPEPLPENVVKWKEGLIEVVDLEFLTLYETTTEKLSLIEGYSQEEDVTFKFNKINPTLYHVEVSNISEQFSIEFLSSFRKEWGVRIIDKSKIGHINKGVLSNLAFQVFDQNDLSGVEHIKIAGFGNGWSIDPESLCASGLCTTGEERNFDFDLLIYYTPQRIFVLGILTSLIFSFVFISIIFLNREKLKVGNR